MKVTIGAKSPGLVPGWWCDAEVDGKAYRVGVLVIDGIGVHPDVWGVVFEADMKIWEDRVPAGIGAREILVLAGLLTGL